MTAKSSTTSKADLEKIARNLGTVLPGMVTRDGDDRMVQVKVKFSTHRTTMGEYEVSLGLTQALLFLDHPGFEIENAYQAGLAKEVWSANWKTKRSKSAGLKGRLGLPMKLLEYFQSDASAQAAIENKESLEYSLTASYPIITYTPRGWQIGTRLGDPRDLPGAHDTGLEHCLHGEYFSGRSGEVGDGARQSDGRIALCQLRATPGANDTHVTATLYGLSGSLKVAIKRNDKPQPVRAFADLGKDREREDELRLAFIQICLRRAKGTNSAASNTALSGDFFLSECEIPEPDAVADTQNVDTSRDR